MGYDSWRLQTPEEYFGTEDNDRIPCRTCRTPWEEHPDTCETCEGDECGDCEGKGCEYEEADPDDYLD